MKHLISIIALIFVVSCGKSIGDRAQAAAVKRTEKTALSSSETWTIFSERPLPANVKVLVNEMEMVNECTNPGKVKIERTRNNGTIYIPTTSALRQDYFNINITDCKRGSVFFSQDYVDQFLIKHPQTGEVSIILSLKN